MKEMDYLKCDNCLDEVNTVIPVDTLHYGPDNDYKTKYLRNEGITKMFIGGIIMLFAFLLMWGGNRTRKPKEVRIREVNICTRLYTRTLVSRSHYTNGGKY
jgi:hypothetical protein